MSDADRRNFFKVCGSFVTALATTSFPAAANASTPTKHYNRVLLMRNGKSMRASDFESGQAYIFHYPYVTTPCLIFNLGETVTDQHQLATESGGHYLWNGGVGPTNSIVAYSAICAHRMTYPARSASFINYRHSKVVFFDAERNRLEQEKIIYCCSERSVYDATRGAQVIGGPAPQPLASIQLDYSPEDDSIAAVGTAGGELFDNFLNQFEFRLQLDFKVVDVAKFTTGKVELETIEEFSDVVARC